MSAPVLTVAGLHQRFGATEVLRNVNLQAHAGERLALIGPNGAGKSTLFNAISGLLRPSAGDIRLHGRAIAAMPVHRRHQLGLARSFQISQLFPRLSVRDHLACAACWSDGQGHRFWRLLARQHRLNTRVALWLERLGLETRAQHLAAELSYAEQRLLSGGALTVSGGGRQKQKTGGVFATIDWNITDMLTVSVAGVTDGNNVSTGNPLGNLNNSSVSYYWQFEATPGSGVFEDIILLPAGDLAIAVGVEHRKEYGEFSPDALAQSGGSTDLAAGPTSGGYSLDEVYAEVQVPLLADVPFAEELTLSAATRYSNYDTFGDTTNSKLGLKWKPVDSLLVRSTWAEGFRAPDVSNLYGGASQTFSFYTDPCDTEFGAARGNARCLQDVPVDFRQPANDADGVANGPGTQTPIPFVAGSNPDLTPETSESATLGVVFSPAFAPGLDLSLDWWTIRIENTIVADTETQVLDDCYLRGIEALTRGGGGRLGRDRGHRHEQRTAGAALPLRLPDRPGPLRLEHRTGCCIAGLQRPAVLPERIQQRRKDRSRAGLPPHPLDSQQPAARAEQGQQAGVPDRAAGDAG